MPAYRLRQGESGRLLAATEYGIWCNMGSGWFNWAYPDCIVYDILYLPGYVVIGCDRGIAYYDRLTGEWAEFALKTAVTSLAVFRGRLVGTGECGQLVYGNGRGGFNVCRFDGLFLVSVIQRGSDIYLCSDRGLFRLAEWQGRFMVLPVRLGFPVSDAAWIGDTMIVATLSRGIEFVR
ncbi:hypothetical protein [Paenibacillus ginsengarvi]|uniref:WG repeat-containing protein n=1 Tax=Paenibacillus ginsengarvi TaxID=400777 RepID=A0A3B0BG60_9BACL|nr:hypothetical protein [Paenibacillus ginsengarvi]RKN71264.1 hypothetical protein D7M11_29665 [Paenibacillus ginsengarvi]